jgi:hypothetical protein
LTPTVLFRIADAGKNQNLNVRKIVFPVDGKQGGRDDDNMSEVGKVQI